MPSIHQLPNPLRCNKNSLKEVEIVQPLHVWVLVVHFYIMLIYLADSFHDLLVNIKFRFCWSNHPHNWSIPFSWQSQLKKMCGSRTNESRHITCKIYTCSDHPLQYPSLLGTYSSYVCKYIVIMKYLDYFDLSEVYDSNHETFCPDDVPDNILVERFR